jgi:hypothetical protein
LREDRTHEIQYDFVDENLNLKRAITIQDFDRDWRNWSR